jgi:hypothetical protein
MNEIFSSLDFVVKFDRSRKLRVDMGSEEKNGWVDNVDGVGREVAWRVTRERTRAGGKESRVSRSGCGQDAHCKSCSQLLIPGNGFPAFSRMLPKLP